MGSRRFWEKNPNPIATKAKIAEMSAIDRAINPRLAQPKNITGVKYSATMVAGAIAGNRMCLT